MAHAAAMPLQKSPVFDKNTVRTALRVIISTTIIRSQAGEHKIASYPTLLLACNRRFLRNAR